jgi:DNA-binding response OmpR family regulator
VWQIRPVLALLVMDDTPSIRERLIHTLRSLVPYEVIAVTDATAALAVLDARPILLVITDYHLSDMRDEKLASAIKAASPTTRVLLITADVALDGGGAWPNVDCCLIKPFPLRELVAAVSTLLPRNPRVRHNASGVDQHRWHCAAVSLAALSCVEAPASFGTERVCQPAQALPPALPET